MIIYENFCTRILTVILHYVYRKFQNNSCNKITFSDIPFHFILQQKIFEDIIKAEFKVNIFITY